MGALAVAIIIALSLVAFHRILTVSAQTENLIVPASNGGNSLEADTFSQLDPVRGGVLGKMTLAVTGSATVTVPALTGITVGTTGASVAVTVLDTPGGNLGAYQFEVSFDPAVIDITGVSGGVSPFDAITAVSSPATGSGTVEWNHFQGGQVSVPANIIVSNLQVVPVGAAGECSALDIFVVEVVDNDGVDIPNTNLNGEVCLNDVDAQAETDLVAAEDNDATGVKPTIDLIKDLAGNLLPGRLIFSYEANITFSSSLALATDCRLKAPFDAGPSDCTIGSGTVHLAATAGVTGSGVAAPIDPLAFVALRLIGSNDPVSGLTQVDLNFVEIIDSLGNNIPQVSPPDSRTFLRGDALADGGISIGDALFIAQAVVNVRTVGEGVGEVNPVNAGSVKHDDPLNDFISVADAVLIAQFLVGNLDEFYEPFD